MTPTNRLTQLSAHDYRALSLPNFRLSQPQVSRKSAQVSLGQLKLNLNSTQTHPKRIPKLSRNYPETIPKAFLGPIGRSPPGGDAFM
ncbi:hypothetical protein QUA42_02600 [Microcoleus sp. Pol11C2]|uniref:hypothetical protein n=1 Tax=Microcoleus sp. Pol11C2 TaxID=3055389 RepID=UPI002FCF4AA8